MASLNKTKNNTATTTIASASVVPAQTYGKVSHNYRTYEGGQSYSVSALEELRRSVLSCMLWENTFYESGNSTANRISQLVASIDPEDVVKVAYEARTMMKLRHVPLLLTIEMLKHEKHKKYVRKLVPLVVNRADEMAELLSLYWKAELSASKKADGSFNSQRSKKKIPMQLLRGIKDTFAKFDDYQLTKYLGSDKPVTMADVIRLVHPDPKLAQQNLPPYKSNVNMTSVYKSIVDGSARAPVDTWEVSLSNSGKEGKKSVFENLIDSNKLPAMALLRNLRGMTEANVSDDKIKKALSEMKVERILPYRFITARKYATGFSKHLETAMFKCLEGVDKLPGKTILLIDNSGSMDSRVSAKSEMNRVQAATGLAILAKEICDSSEVLLFDQNTYAIVNGAFKCVSQQANRSWNYSSSVYNRESTATKLPRNHSDRSNLRGFDLEDAIAKVGKGGTDLRQAIDYVNQNYDYDRIIVFTDEQSSTVPSAPNAKGYVINVATYQNGVGYGPWTHINGFSEATLAYITEYEKQFS